MSHSEVIHDRR